MPEKEIVQQVQDEIKKTGENVKTTFEKMNRNFEELKQKVDGKGNAEEIEKLSAAVATRQEALEKKFNDRIDNFEVAMQRLPAGKEDKDVVYAEAKAFAIAKAAKMAKDRPVRISEVNVDVNQYSAYKNVLGEYFRCAGDERALSPEQVKLLQIGVDPDGGYLVTPQISNRILQRLYESDPVRQLATVQSITTEAIEEYVDFGDAGSEWEGETVATTDYTTPTWNKKKISTHSLSTRPRATQSLLEDASINVESWLADKVANRFARTEGAAFVNGSGAARPRGFLTYANGTTFGTVERINMGNATALTADGFIDVKYGLKEQYLNLGTWMMVRGTLAAAMKLKDGNGDYLWKPGMMEKDPYSTLLGLPVRMSTTMPAIAASALSVALADWSRAYMIVDRIGITVLKDPYTQKPAVEFYYRKRVGGDVIDFDAIKIGVISA